MKNYQNCIAKRLRKARSALGISQKKLGILTGIDEHSASARMNQYETGKHIPNFLTLQHIGKVLGYPVAFFYCEDDITAEIIHLTSKLSTPNKQKLLNTVKSLVIKHERDLSLTE